ncbi:MAG: beta-ketoacyl synthase N-terminal-like domain-containing protein [Myxococcales bacterium]
MACDRLHDGSADAMLAGAVTCCDDLFIHTGFTALQALSPSGRSRPFHRDADGLVPAEGAGVVVLKRLSDAVAAKDRVLGVIRGVGLSNDGRGSGLIAPSEEGQVRAMRAAYEQAGLSPSDVSLLECHATGTAVGDRTEIHSLRRVFEAASALPIGSLKSNFGHSVAVAGVAGLLKVLGAIEARERPPTLHTEQPLDELAKSPLRLLQQSEPWPSDGPRRAAVSAFGFGGCNAHLVVEEFEPTTKPRAAKKADERVELAIVGMGAAVGDGSTLGDFAAALESKTTQPRARASSLALEVSATRFPPRDLEQALPQQTWLLAASREALAGLELPKRERLGVYVGMGCDPEVARFGARWRSQDWAQALQITDPSAWAEQLERAFIGPLEASGVLGTLPNLPANRLNFQFDLAGPGLTLSAEELSGLRALEVAAAALKRGEIDVALVGASDFTSPVHEAACRSLGLEAQAGDGAVALAVMRAADARREKRPVFSVIAFEDTGREFDSSTVVSKFGRAHAASGLIEVAAAALESQRTSKSLRVQVEAFGGQRGTVCLRPPPPGTEAARLPAPVAPKGPSVSYPAHRAEPRLPALPVLTDPWVGVRAPEPPGAQMMPPAPALAPVLDFTDDEPRPIAAPAASQTAPVAAAAARPDVARWLAEQQSMLARAHQHFVESQAQAQQQFLQLRERMNTRLLALSQGQPVVPMPLPAEPQTAAPVVAPVVAPVAPRPNETRETYPGPKLDRRGLETHASGKISEIYGPLFAKQDGFRRQVRMPEPPLLLADRLLGIEAEPGSMGKGRLWTETDVTPDAWYLHDGRMPAGILIESGQADLMLISYLGVDFLNRSERVYRLLGCDLTYHGALPAPDETLQYEISVDGHANQGDVRLFFFHYDCVAKQGGKAASRPQLSVRNGQAGFFTDEELADSAGVLWDAATGEHQQDARVDAPAVRCQATRFDRARLEDFARGRADLCFGKGYELGATHTRSPRIASGKMLLLEEVTELNPTGGPWGRGYLRAVDHLKPDDWFFEGHFKNDPCMPGTLMFEGCLQAMAIYLASMGYTLDKDGWRFEPVPEETYKLRCRGQATPQSKELVYEVFVEGIEAGPTPTLWADLLCTVDGRKAFHCRRMGLRLVPGWPLDSLAESRSLVDTKPVAAAKGFSFGARSVLACAWGKPSEAFGPMYEPFDGPRRVPRLPGPPYLFMSRVSKVTGEIGAMQVGSSVEVEYDIPPDAWYFEANGARTMPFCVLLEAALQPCGWLASYIGSALKSPEDLFFRNLDGTGTLLEEIGPDAGTLITRSKLTQLSRSAGMIIVSFDVTCDVRSSAACPEPAERERRVYVLKTVFGFFPKAALAAQVGLPTTDEQRAVLAELAPREAIELRSRPARFFEGTARLPSEKLQMLHRVSGRWPAGGAAGLGRYRSEFDVESDTWFLKAHFFQDPVQPGSLGLEAMVQLLQLAMIDRGLASPGDRFEPIALGAPMTWKYRGQVLPKNRRVNVVLDLTKLGEDERGKVAVADASLWVDGMRIYEATGVAMRAVKARVGDEEVLSTSSHPFLADHQPTWTVPALPLMSMVDRLMRRVERESGATVVAVEDAKVHRWLPIVGSVRTKTEVERISDGCFRATLLSWRDAARSELLPLRAGGHRPPARGRGVPEAGGGALARRRRCSADRGSLRVRGPLPRPRVPAAARPGSRQVGRFGRARGHRVPRDPARLAHPCAAARLAARMVRRDPERSRRLPTAGRFAAPLRAAADSRPAALRGPLRRLRGRRPPVPAIRAPAHLWDEARRLARAGRDALPQGPTRQRRAPEAAHLPARPAVRRRRAPVEGDGRNDPALRTGRPRVRLAPRHPRRRVRHDLPSRERARDRDQGARRRARSGPSLDRDRLGHDRPSRARAAQRAPRRSPASR